MAVEKHFLLSSTPILAGAINVNMAVGTYILGNFVGVF